MTFFKDKTSKQASSLRRQGSSANALQPATLGSCFRRNDKALIVVLLLCAPSVQGQDHAPPSQPPQNQAPAAVKPITYQNLSLEGLRKEMAFVASQIQQQEAAASTIESQLQNIKRQSEEIQSSMSVQKNQLGTGMESLVRLSQTSPLMAFL